MIFENLNFIPHRTDYVFRLHCSLKRGESQLSCFQRLVDDDEEMLNIVSS